jgi:hypothetical protein
LVVPYLNMYVTSSRKQSVGCVVESLLSKSFMNIMYR